MIILQVELIVSGVSLVCIGNHQGGHIAVSVKAGLLSEYSELVVDTAGAETDTVASGVTAQVPVELRKGVSTELHHDAGISSLHHKHLRPLLSHLGSSGDIDTDQSALDDFPLPLDDVAGLTLVLALITVHDPGDYQIFLMAPHFTAASLSVMNPGVLRKWIARSLTGQLQFASQQLSHIRRWSH